MSEQFEPTTDDFRQVWAAFNGYGGLVARPHSASMDEGYAEFDRWLAKVKSDAVREAEAKRVHIVFDPPQPAYVRVPMPCRRCGRTP